MAPALVSFTEVLFRVMTGLPGLELSPELLELPAPSEEEALPPAEPLALPSGVAASGVEASGAEPSGLEPSGLEPSGIEASGIEASGLEASGWS